MMFAADNIRLRALEPEDLEWLYSVENDEELWQWGSSNVPYSRYTLKTYIAESRHDIYADGQLRLVIETEVAFGFRLCGFDGFFSSAFTCGDRNLVISRV